MYEDGDTSATGPAGYHFFRSELPLKRPALTYGRRESFNPTRVGIDFGERDIQLPLVFIYLLRLGYFGIA